MRNILLIAITFVFSLGLFAQTEKHVVFLKNKDNNPYSLSNPLAFLTQRSIDRRTKSNIALDLKDLPVTPSYVAQIAATGATVVYPLKWFNAVVVNTNSSTVLAAISALPFVDHIDQVLADKPVATGIKSGTQAIEGIPPFTISNAGPVTSVKSTGTINYGMAYNQAHMISVDGLHSLGYQGEGMMIAILDAGFNRVDQVSAFDSLWLNNRILGTRDFNQPGNNVYADSMHYHGTMVLSTMGANLPGQIVGTAPHASFWLIRTEVGWYEELIEEYNWAGGAEFADSLGADVINSSLGYTEFGTAANSHTYASMDGNTTPVTRAADLAASRGILVVNSAGNDGANAWHYISAPADGDSVFTLGAVDWQGSYAYFSSTGPTFDRRIKPDVVTQGQGSTVVSPDGSVGQGSGTSFSSPIMAGALACLWQSTPAFSAEQLRVAVRNTASKAFTPDSLYGYGIPNVMNARLFLATTDSGPIETETFTLGPIPFAANPILIGNLKSSEKITIETFSVSGKLMISKTMMAQPFTAVTLSEFNTLPAGVYLLRITSGTSRQVIRAVKI
ncbi:MAG: S8 family serine peptidase [Bacteroidales bacterium]